MSKARFSFKQLLITQFVLGAMIPTLLLSSLLIAAFRDIQTEEQIEKQAAQTQSAVLQLEFELEKLSLQLQQLAKDSNVALAASSGVFAPDARNNMLSVAQQHPLASGLLLLDSKYWVAEAIPISAMVLPISPLQPELTKLYQADYTAVNTTVLLEADQFSELLLPAPNRPGSSHWLVMFLPLKLADSTGIDPRSKLSGALVALISAEQLNTRLQQYLPDARLLNIYWQQQALLPDVAPLDDSVVTRTSLTVPATDLSLSVVVASSRQQALQPITELTYRFVQITLLFLVILLVTGWLFVRREIRPLAQLSDLVAGYAKGELTQPVQQFPYIEFDSIASVLQNMAQTLSEHQHSLEAKVTQRTAELQRAVADLHQTNTTLIKTQQQLIEAEKSSQIGILVAGIAREITAPVSSSMRAVSALDTQHTQIIAAVRQSTLKRSELEQYLRFTADAIEQLGLQLKRAQELLQSFNAMAVDQSREQKRNFNLYDYLHDVVLNLRYELGQYQVKTDIIGDKVMVVQSYPGSFSRILTNLILNSLEHGFDRQQKHHISISYQLLENGLLELRYQDDGAGMTAEVMQRMYEPFFTTAQQEGGSGLGLSIVHSLVTQQLKGTINCNSTPGNGCTFILTLPVRVVIKPR